MRHKRISSSTLVLLSVALIVVSLLTWAGFGKDNCTAVAAEPNRVSVSSKMASRDMRDTVTLPPPIKEAVKLEATPVEVKEQSYTDEDLDLLSRIIYAEVGCTWIPDEVQFNVGSVVLNRVKSPLFPNTIYDVIYQEGQYSPTWNGTINSEPDKRTVDNARKLLEEGSVLPENVIFQANFVQGDGVYSSYYDEPLGTTTYFCYGNS